MQVNRLKSKKSGIEKMERNWGIILALPAMLGFLIFTLGPMIASLGFSLTDWNIGGKFSFIGIENYKTMFTEDKLFSKSLFVTVYYTFCSVPLVMCGAFLVAMLLNQKVKGLSIFRTIFYLPVLVPSVANTMLWLWMFNPDFGLLNSILGSFGVSGQQWIYHEQTSIPSLVLMSTWGLGNAAVIFLAGLQGVPTHLYEAVEMDGGGALSKLRHVTIPMMTPTIFFNLVMALINTFQIFNEAYIMTEGGPNNSTLFYVYYLYRTAFTDTKMGYASALAWVLFIVILFITSILFLTSKRWVYYEGGK
ncbi:spermidine/putrescine ABC transporter permease [Lederbergia ruris]|uniref:Spermidine/putrescine ABC transporter permease n=1 Tax=Lederbergia ruris TaxID=217495 RepID=A0ABQ4KP28_9BACI|nr:sugar ABC transporter permease [Lederbergia ruris]GIN59697.1 spermidine/putrescine ABC transporter permease [Lederbergia ruris]